MIYLNKLALITSVFCLLGSQAFCDQAQRPNHNCHNSAVNCNHVHGDRESCNMCYKPLPNRTTAFFVQAAYTYWRPYQEGMDILIATGTETIQGNVIAPKTYYRSGFKAGLGANNTEYGWFWAVNYTWFDNNSSMRESTLIPTINYVSPFGSNGLVISEPFSKFSNQFNRIDGLFDRDFYSGPRFTFRPWIGFLGAWEKQRLNIEGTGVQSQLTQPVTMNFYQNWWGLGPYGGMNCMYNFSQMFGIYIKPGVSILYAHHTITNEQYSSEEGDNPYVQHTNYKKNNYNMEPMLEMSLGVNLNFMYENFGLGLTAAWEIQTYFSHNGFQEFYSPTGIMGNYTMQGLTVGVRLSI